MPTATQSPERLLCTFPGSLPRPVKLAAMLDDEASGSPPDPGQFAETAAAAVADAVGRQAAAGIDIVSPGEMYWPSFMHVADRLTGFTGPMAPYFPTDLAGLEVDFAEFFVRTGDVILPSNTSQDIRYQSGRTEASIRAFTSALRDHPGVHGAFMAAPSPGVLARLGTSAFTRPRDFVFAIAEAMRTEYQMIAAAGLAVQVDSPDLAMCKHTDFPQLTVAEFRDIARMHVEALNYATRGIPREQLRLHLCWGNYEGPHYDDLPLADIIDVVYGANVGVLLIEQANGRHRSEWRVFADHPLPEGMILAAGVVDNISPHVEHPTVIADALVHLAGIVGRDRLMATTDCGFGTFAGAPQAAESVAYRKLASLAEGTQMASKLLWQ